MSFASARLTWTTAVAMAMVSGLACAPHADSSAGDADDGVDDETSVDSGVSNTAPPAAGTGVLTDAWVPDIGGDAEFDPQTCADILSSLSAPVVETPFPSEGEALAFVYGTLLAGESNHHYMGDSALVGAALTVPCFRLYDLGSYPGMVPDGQTQVVGEVYGVSEATRDALDQLEGHPSFYRRVAIPVELNGGITTVETYLLRPSQVQGYPVIASGDWRDP